MIQTGASTMASPTSVVTSRKAHAALRPGNGVIFPAVIIVFSWSVESRVKFVRNVCRLDHDRANHNTKVKPTIPSRVVSDLKFSVRPLCPLCLCGDSFVEFVHHRDTENTDCTEKTLKPGHCTFQH